MSGLHWAAAALSLALFLGLVLIANRRLGALLAQIGTGLAALLLFWTATELDRPDAPLLPWGIGGLAATTAAMGYHLFLGRFDRAWHARGVFLIVALGLAAALAAIFVFLA